MRASRLFQLWNRQALLLVALSLFFAEFFSHRGSALIIPTSSSRKQRAFRWQSPKDVRPRMTLFYDKLPMKGANARTRMDALKNDKNALDIWCYCRGPQEIPVYADYDALLLLKEEIANSIRIRTGTPKFVVDISKERNQVRLLRGRSVAGIMVNVTEEKGQENALAAIGSVEWVVAYTDSANTNGKNKKPEEGEKTLFDTPWRMIPAENLIGAATQTGTKIAFVVERVEDVGGLAHALEVGVDALCVRSDAPKELWDAVLLAKKKRLSLFPFHTTSPFNQPQPPQDAHAQTQVGATQIKTKPPIPQAAKQYSQIQLATEQATLNGSAMRDVAAKVLPGSCWRLPKSPGSSGSSVAADRVCIDFVQNLSPTEGCWIGSSAKLMALVLSEAAPSEFVPSRPFRVNAGPVHSYVCLGDGATTKYLGELQAGDEVLVFDAMTGKSRAVAVGRLKLEIRPCVLVALQANFDNNSQSNIYSMLSGQIFLQQAETVRLGQPGGEFVRITNLDVAMPDEVEKQNSILIRVTPGGTHLGNRYADNVDER